MKPVTNSNTVASKMISIKSDSVCILINFRLMAYQNKSIFEIFHCRDEKKKKKNQGEQMPVVDVQELHRLSHRFSGYYLYASLNFRSCI